MSRLILIFACSLVASAATASDAVPADPDTSEAEKAGNYSEASREAEIADQERKVQYAVDTAKKYYGKVQKLFKDVSFKNPSGKTDAVSTQLKLLSILSPRPQKSAFESLKTGNVRYPENATPDEVIELKEHFERLEELPDSMVPPSGQGNEDQGGDFWDSAVDASTTKQPQERSDVSSEGSKGNLKETPKPRPDPEDRAIARMPPSGIERAVLAKPKNPGLQYARGFQQERLGNAKGAFESYQAAVDGGRRDPKTYTALARSAFALGKLETAHEAAGRALAGGPSPELKNIAQSYYELSKDRLSLNQERTEAIEGREVSDFDIGAISLGTNPGSNELPNETLDPRSRRSHTLMKQARRALRVGNSKEAVSLATRALELNPDNARALTFRSAAFQRLGKFGEALDDAESVVALAPGSATGLLSRAFAKAKLGRYDEALEEARAVLSSNPKSLPARRILAFAQAGLGDREGMLQTLKEGAALSPVLAGIYKRALQLPEGDDLTLLFSDGTIAKGEKGNFGKFELSTSSQYLWGFGALAAGLLFLGVAKTMRKKEDVVPKPEPSLLPAGFDLLGTLGTGGMGVVYKARDSGTNRFVAVKRLREEIRGDARAVERVLKEARAVARLKHPNIVSVYGARKHRGEVFLVFEHVSGKTISELMGEKERFTLSESVSILAQACAAIDHAHGHGVVHRDIKPSNLMVDEEGSLRVMDFGIARLVTDAATRATRTGTVAGTPPYMAPEQEEGKTRRESDIFALGVLFYELVTGELPFPGLGAALHLQKREGRFVPPSQRVPGGLPPELDAIIAKAIAPDPGARYASAGEFASALKNLLPA